MQFDVRDGRSGPRWRTLERTYRTKLFRLFVCLSLFASLFQAKKDNRRLVRSRFQEAVDACQGFSQPLGVSDDTPFSTQISKLLLRIDHVFVLTTDICEIGLPRSFAGRASCVVGTKIDVCAPNEFIRGPYTHAMKVSFMHAAVLYLAQKANYRHVALIEDDVAVRHGVFSDNLSPDFGNILNSTWSMIRFGFRPFFLEKTSREPCPLECRCYVKQDTARDFCKLTKAGCDMRSSDFYVIHKTSYASLLSKLLDLKQANSKRIIDTAPMRSFANQWLILPQVSIQTKLDIPMDYQIGLGALYVKKCVLPRPVSRIASQQFLDSSVQYTVDIESHS
jgi:hypothetical protein